MPSLLTSRATSCVDLELRSLPSTGITRFHQYYGPLRHPSAPSLTVTGFKVGPYHCPRQRVSRVACVFQYVHAAATTPAQRLGACFARFPSHVSLPRIGGRVGLCIVLFEVCSALTRVTAYTLAKSPDVTLYIEGLSHFVTSMTAPIAPGWSGCRVGLAPTGKRRLITAHAKSRHWKTIITTRQGLTRLPVLGKSGHHWQATVRLD